MLVLTRKVGEGVKIDENIFVRIVQVKGKQVRLGIEAPKETRIQREELNESKGGEQSGQSSHSQNEVPVVLKKS